MDLRSVLNTSDNGERSAAKVPPTPPQQQQHHQHSHPPRGPPPANAQYTYHEYPHHPAPQPSPGKPGGPEYHHGGQYPHGAYPPQSPYQAQAAYPPRASHPGSFADPRSPGSAPPVQSPYRHSVSSTTGPGQGPSQGYFPNQAPHEIRSPSQRHQYPPAQYQPPPHHVHQHQRHDSHPPPQVQPTTPYLPHHPVPQTPPIGHPGQQHRQRTHSAQSTPTSAHSQQAYGPPYSPAPQHHHIEYRRQPSQPPGPPSQPHSANPSSANSQGPPPFSQPSSPYQHKIPFAGGATVAQAHSSPNGPPHPQQPQHRLSHPRPPSQPAHESPRPDSAKRRSTSEREHSMSVSPKTRVGSLPSNAEHRPSASEGDYKADHPMSTVEAKQEQPAATPAKRKLDDRNMSPGELEYRNSRPPPGEVNGQHSKAPQAVPQAAPRQIIKEGPANEASVNEAPANEESTPTVKESTTPAPSEQDEDVEDVVRVCYSEPPVWALSLRTLGKTLPKNANYVFPARPCSPPADDANETRRSRTPDADETRVQSPSEPRGPQEFLGPWEASITGVKPYEEMSRAVADFLFIHVINAQDAQEISSRGIEFEIEAKLGTLIDKDTNHRVEKLIESECVLRDTGRVAFQSSMTEAHHKAFNEFLNNIVIQTDPRSAHGRKRVQVHYKHRREIDKYFELPLDMQARIPGCVRSRLGTRKNVKARVTYDEKSGEVLNKIVKARVADIDLHMPKCPMDCRISINLEMNWDGPVEELEQLAGAPTQGITDRRKDRLSYKQGHYQIDLTQVTMPGAQGRGDKEHELEIEVSGATIIEQGRRAMGGEPHGYQELVEGFLDNVRVLARKARDFHR